MDNSLTLRSILNESPVGKRGRTTKAEAKEFVKANDDIISELAEQFRETVYSKFGNKSKAVFNAVLEEIAEKLITVKTPAEEELV